MQTLMLLILLSKSFSFIGAIFVYLSRVGRSIDNAAGHYLGKFFLFPLLFPERTEADWANIHQQRYTICRYR